jgi:Domain of unknown function (DUF4837)
MKINLLLIFLLSWIFFSCNLKFDFDSSSTNAKVNSLTVIINDQLWNGEIGDSLRKKFAAPIEGLPQEEPLFTIDQFPTKVLNGYESNSRNIMIIKIDEKNSYRIEKDEFGSPQTVIHISGSSIEEIINKIENNYDFLLRTFKKSEIMYTQKIIEKNLLDDAPIQNKFSVSIKAPNTYKYAKRTPSFLWLKKETLSGNTSLLMYFVTVDRIMKNNDYINNIIGVRDSIGSLYIHSKILNSKMITEESYAPYFFKTVVSGKSTYQTKGTWEIKGDYMSGAFNNYAIYDNINNRFLVIEGFCYAPSTSKRDLMHELEAIVKSVRFLN